MKSPVTIKTTLEREDIEFDVTVTGIYYSGSRGDRDTPPEPPEIDALTVKRQDNGAEIEPTESEYAKLEELLIERHEDDCSDAQLDRQIDEREDRAEQQRAAFEERMRDQ